MRSSNKQRSRNKSNSSNRNRSVGNVVNRVFDSAGPEGRVRGTPQQVIEKYQALARDAQLSGDRVAAENFQQHAEHYTRLLTEAQREQNERQAAQDAQAAARQAQNNPSQNNPSQNNGSQNAGSQNTGSQNTGSNNTGSQNAPGHNNQDGHGNQPDAVQEAPSAPLPGQGDQPEIAAEPKRGPSAPLETVDDPSDEPTLVETPESKATASKGDTPRRPRTRTRRPAKTAEAKVPEAEASADITPVAE